MDIIFYTILTLSGLGILIGIVLYIIAQKFKVAEDPLVAAVEELLPGTNCGACGLPGCHGFAEACAKAESLADLFCTTGGNDCMTKIAKVLGKEVSTKDPRIAVLRCAGSPDKRPRTLRYDGAASCAASTMLYSGDTNCPYGCLGLGDCVPVCKFDAIYIDPVTHLPVISDEKCTACGACVKACPVHIIELRLKGKKHRRVYVTCANTDKGPAAKKACAVACIGCGLCVKACPFDAITITNFLAYIDAEKCKLCRKCVEVCPTKAIIETNFPPRKAPAASAAPAAKPAQSGGNNSPKADMA